MNLILSSCDFRNDYSKKFIIDNLKMPIDKCKVLFFPNEKATLEAIQSELYYDRMQEHGFERKNTFVFNRYEPEESADLDIDAVYISGGNTFHQLDILKKCGFDKVIIDYVNKGVTYIGGSAGAHIATKNVEHVIAFDGTPIGIIDFTGLGLFDGIIFCHYTDERRRYYEKALSEGKYNVYALTDDESIVIND